MAVDTKAGPSTVSSSSPTQIVCHPLVLLSVVDHHQRSVKGTNKRVLGVLLGQDNGKTVNVANSFAVPFEEDEKDPKTWFLDHDYIEGMAEMFKKVNAREKLIGFYHTGPKLRSSDLEIDRLFKRFVPRPIMLIIDVRGSGNLRGVGMPGTGEEGGGLGGEGLPVEGYCAVEEIKDDGTSTSKTFHHIPSVIAAEEAEEIGVEHLLRDITSLPVSTSSSTTHQSSTSQQPVMDLSSRVGLQLSSLRGFRNRLKEIEEYLEMVGRGEMEQNHEIGYLLQDIFNLLPGLEELERGGVGGNLISSTLPGSGKDSMDLDGAGSPEAGLIGMVGGKRPFTEATNDQMLVVYLSSLIRAVIALHNLINNKASGGLDEFTQSNQTSTTTNKKDSSSKDSKDKDKDKDKKDGGGGEGEDKSRGI